MLRFNCLLRNLNQIQNVKLLNYRPTSSNDQKISRNNLHQTHQLQGIELISNTWYFLKEKAKSVSPVSPLEKSKLQEASVALHEAAIDQIDHLEWFKYFELEDDLASWFQITTLHIWMILVRVSAPDDDKRSLIFRNEVSNRVWDDLSNRINKLGAFPSKDKKKVTSEFSLAFQASLVAYDEGLIGTDRELAASLWRTFFEKKCPDYTKLEFLVEYVRAQLQHLAHIKNEELVLSDRQIKWKKIKFPK